MILVALVPLTILLLSGFLFFRRAARAATEIIPIAPGCLINTSGRSSGVAG